MSQLKPKPVKESQVIRTEIVHPGDTNPLGTIFGGTVVAWIDMAAAMCAMRHARTNAVTASIDAVSFLSPVKVGEFVIIKASVNYTGKTSMEIGVRVESEHPKTGERKHTASAYLTFVAIDEKGRPIPVPPVLPETDVEKKRFKMAEKRRASRLKIAKEREEIYK
ncbi:MAG TPA: acyl-CoA thioesterase [Bdellovibrionota bacterium]|nr:acyl-CoA thioesterase [Bdellovibrionota bacterium]